MLHVAKACLPQQRCYVSQSVFARVFSVNPLTLVELTAAPWTGVGGGLGGPQVHFNSRFLQPEKRDMPLLPQVKVDAQLHIDIQQHVFVRRSGHPWCVVVRVILHPGLIAQINAQHQTAGIAL